MSEDGPERRLKRVHHIAGALNLSLGRLDEAFKICYKLLVSVIIVLFECRTKDG